MPWDYVLNSQAAASPYLATLKSDGSGMLDQPNAKWRPLSLDDPLTGQEMLFGGAGVVDWRKLGYDGPLPEVPQAVRNSAGEVEGGGVSETKMPPELKQFMADNGYGMMKGENAEHFQLYQLTKDGQPVPGASKSVALANSDAYNIVKTIVDLGMAAGGAYAAYGGAGTQGLSGMDLAADAAIGSGNNITTAGSMLGSGAGTVGAGTSGLSGMDLAADVPGAAAPSGTTATGGTTATMGGGSTNVGGTSGMDLAADAAAGTGNNIVTAGSQLGGTSLAQLAQKAGMSVVDFAKTPAGMKAIALGVGALAAGASGGGGSDGVSAGTAAAAGNLAQMGQDQIAWNKAAYAAGQPTRDAATAGALQAQTGQLATQTNQTAIANDLTNYERSTFRPLQQKIVADAMGYDTPGRRAQAVAEATADTTNAFSTAEQSLRQNLGRAGITPSSGRALALMGDASYAKAGAITGATAGAVRNIEATGAKRMLDANAIGANLNAQAGAATGLGITAGNSVIGAGQGAVAAQSAGIPQMNVGMAGGASATANSGSLYSNQARIDAAKASEDAALWGALGSAAGQYFATSDENQKDNTKTPASTDGALEEINELDVKDGWNYKADPKGKKRTGPMAQNVRASMGDAVAPNGKQIDLVSMNGKVIAGMQALTKKVAKLEARM